jgi:uncharacterized protein (TIGR02217 family)
MAAYPTVSFSRTMNPKIVFKTLISNFNEEGAEQRKQKWLYPKRDFTLEYKYITKTNMETLWAFYIARKGSYGAFNFFMPEPLADYPSYIKEYVGTGDGSTTVFNCPSKAGTSVTVYKGGAALTGGGSDYTFSSEGGADGADKITMTAAPDSGEYLTISFTGALKIRCRFAEDNLSWEDFQDRVATVGIKLKGILNE